MTPDPAAPAPMPTSPEIEAVTAAIQRLSIRCYERGWERSVHPPAEDVVLLDDLKRCIAVYADAYHAATLAHLAAQAPDGVREMVEDLVAAIIAERGVHEPKAALLAAFTALRGEVDHWKAEATVREERSEMWRTQYNNLRAATAANADAWGAESAALVQRAELAEEASRQDRGALQSARSEAMGWQQRAEAAEGLLGDVLLSNDIGKSHLDSEIPDWAVRVRRFLAPRGASDGSGPADREGR